MNRANYKRLGNFIRLVDERNKDLKVKTLLGLTINKEFIPSVANTVGTNMANYKIIRKNQFACSLMQVRRDKKIPIALLKEFDEAIISQAYPVFEVIDANVLNPDYLMMWFSRKEFDRLALFLAVGGVRGSLEWEDFMNTELPIPSIEKQNAIVAEYNTVVNRIKLNEQLNQKLEETAQAIYKHWFVDFEFPNEQGKPYKSTGGKMVWNEELGKEIPEGWRFGKLGDIIKLFDSKRIPLSSSERDDMNKIYPYYGAAALMDYVDDYLFEGTYILLGEDGSVVTKKGTPILQYVSGKFWVNNHAHVLKAKNGFSENSLYVLLLNTNITDIITGGVQSKISQTNLKSVSVLYPNRFALKDFNLKLESIFKKKKKIHEMTLLCEKTKEILLSKMTKVKTETEVAV